MADCGGSMQSHAPAKWWWLPGWAVVRQHLIPVEVVEKAVSALTKLKEMPEALQLLESVLLQNSCMSRLLRYRDMRPPPKARATCAFLGMCAAVSACVQL